MNEIIAEIKHHRDLIRIHRDAIAQLNTTIAMFGALTPPFIQLDKKERIAAVNGIAKRCIKFLGPQPGEKLNDIINKLRGFISTDAEAVSTTELEQVYRWFNSMIDLLAITESDVQQDQPVSILFMAAQPDDNVRLQFEFDDIVNQVQSHVKEKSLVFLLPSWNTDYGKLLTRLNHDRPNVLHYSGHGDNNGMHLVNNFNYLTQVISNHHAADIFEGKESHLQLVILSSCFSSELAGIISTHGIYVLGVEGAIDISVATELAKHFYLGFSAQRFPISIFKAIKYGCINFALIYPRHKSSICLYRDGEKIDYEQI